MHFIRLKCYAEDHGRHVHSVGLSGMFHGLSGDYWWPLLCARRTCERGMPSLRRSCALSRSLAPARQVRRWTIPGAAFVGGVSSPRETSCSFLPYPTLVRNRGGTFSSRARARGGIGRRPMPVRLLGTCGGSRGHAATTAPTGGHECARPADQRRHGHRSGPHTTATAWRWPVGPGPAAAGTRTCRSQSVGRRPGRCSWRTQSSCRCCRVFASETSPVAH